jgi:drug/metabolite transporter (DMT)-like permease
MTHPAVAPARAPALMLRGALWLVMPLLGLGNQYLAVRTAHALEGVSPGWVWIAAAIRSPFVQAWAGLEVVTLFVWMGILTRLKLSAAFPMTALGYMLILGMGWTLLGEPVTAWQVIGSCSILLGVWLLGDDEAPV